MDTMLNPQNEEKSFSLETSGEKSELMKIFESRVNDIYWAYKDLLKEIFEKDDEAKA